ncbi:hypothetical protein QKU48_gp0610 [Fadolivirus algeromassiliense]|jgi:hypothetical protein|uniref:Uncharacterized protein n=1 Tax=Fadolivirus FV1/VV64 TaxID=3070911 RepID=A0A7D3UPN5_9VIRU|nr:hypothetical protein QKU48_gp0610 [Fadolivirus algeromassiliense]QKF94068.1 hypothetical protein Fadolivirus_1_610 [Fadolivirus FV1/VV64]
MELNKINKMTFSQLRNELALCNDPIKEKLIRNLMYIRYKQHINNKIKMEEMTRQKKMKMIERENRNRIKTMEQVNDNQNMMDMLDDQDNISIDPDEYEIKQNNISLNELDDENMLFDKRDITEYERDAVNNNIVDRLNSDIDIRTMRENRNTKKEFVMPYSDDVSGNYAPFNENKKLPINNFSNIRPKNNKRI